MKFTSKPSDASKRYVELWFMAVISAFQTVENSPIFPYDRMHQKLFRIIIQNKS